MGAAAVIDPPELIACLLVSFGRMPRGAMTLRWSDVGCQRCCGGTAGSFPPIISWYRLQTQCHHLRGPPITNGSSALHNRKYPPARDNHLRC
eukprot:scaffold2173_cov38-Cyclotella_meneghiniana.AAC.1